MDHMQRVALAIAGGMRGVQSAAHLRADVGGEDLGQQVVPAARDLESAAQRAAVHELQHEDGTFGLGLQVIDGRDDAGVVQEPDHPRLVRQHVGDAHLAPALRREHLDHHPPAECPGALQLGQPDLAHPAQPEPLEEHVAPAHAVAGPELAHARSSGPDAIDTLLSVLTVAAAARQSRQWISRPEGRQERDT